MPLYLQAWTETRNLSKFAIRVPLKTKINRLLVPEVESALSQQNRLVFFHSLAAYHVLAEIAIVGPTTTKSGFFWHKLNSIKKKKPNIYRNSMM